MLKLISVERNSCLADRYCHNVTYYDTEENVYVEFMKQIYCEDMPIPEEFSTVNPDWLHALEAQYGLTYTSFWRDDDVEYGGFLSETIGRICV